MKALVEYCQGINSKYNYRKNYLNEYEATEKFLVRNIYEHLLYCKCEKNKNLNKKLLKKIS